MTSHAPADHEITRLLQEWQLGDADAAAALWPIVYDELRRLASSFMTGERDEHTLQPTALVHETYLKLIEQRHVEWRNRRHFFAIAARVMRRVLVDHARARAARKRPGKLEVVPLDLVSEPPGSPAVDVVAVDVALNDLERLHPRQAMVVELRFFGGLSMDEIAEVLKCSAKTVQRDWGVARAWMYREIGGV